MSQQPSPNSITLRSVNDQDAPFLLQVYKSSRGDDLRELGWTEEKIAEFLEMQYEAQERFLTSEYKRAVDQIVVYEGQNAGRVIVERRDHEIRCVDLALLPERRNLGIGTTVIKKLQADAKVEKQPLRLQVIRFNRAVVLFERLGFVRTSETGTHFQMEWLPDQ